MDTLPGESCAVFASAAAEEEFYHVGMREKVALDKERETAAEKEGKGFGGGSHLLCKGVYLGVYLIPHPF